jgi:hypothetical protein
MRGRVIGGSVVRLNERKRCVRCDFIGSEDAHDVIVRMHPTVGIASQNKNDCQIYLRRFDSRNERTPSLYQQSYLPGPLA